MPGLRRRRATVGTLMAAIAGVAVVLGSYRAGRDSVPSPAMVWVTHRGTRYHREGCRYVRAGGVRTPLDEAKASYRPCAVCRPPR